MKVVIEQLENSKGDPMISIRKDVVELHGYPFSFGIKKAKLLLAALEQEPEFLEKFIKENE